MRRLDLDELALALTEPMSRRRAIGVVGATVILSRLAGNATPAVAQGHCPKLGDPKATKECSRGSGPVVQFVCVTPDLTCCNSDRCAVACSEPWKVCRNAGTATAACDDTEAMCHQPGETATTFCSKHVTIQGGTCTDTRDQIAGWCCVPGAECGTDVNECICKGTNCRDICCPEDYECGTIPPGATICVRKCPDRRPRCGASGSCCGFGQTCTTLPHPPLLPGMGSESAFEVCQCMHGRVMRGGRCVSNASTPADPSLIPGTNGSWSSGARGGAADGGGGGRSVRASAPAAGASPALRVLAAISAQRGAACAAFTDGHADPQFTRSVKVARVSTPVIAAGPGLDAAVAAALSKLVAADARASAQIAAAATAFARSRGAGARHRSAARRQLLASARYATQAAATLATVARLRAAAAAAMKTAATPEVVVTAAAVAAFQRRVRSGGVPADLRARLAALGLGAHDVARVRAGLVSNVLAAASVAGPALVAPLSDHYEAAQLANLVGELRRYAGAARRHPIARGH